MVGSSALLSPELSLYLANLGFLSPDSRCFSFDARANGYARGEGVCALFLKPIEHAVRDGDVVRAVIRSTASNQDGRTPGLTQPSSEAQEALIRHTYAKAGLGLGETRYVEAHGTGTPTGDPIEVKAIGSVFGASRSLNDPLFVYVLVLSRHLISPHYLPCTRLTVEAHNNHRILGVPSRQTSATSKEPVA